MTVDIDHVPFKSLSRSWLSHVTYSVLDSDHNTLPFSFFVHDFIWLLIMSQWIVNRILINYLLNELSEEVFSSCFFVNAVANLIIIVSLLSIDRNVQTASKTKNRVICESVKQFKISLIVLVKSLKKRWRQIVWNLNSKNVSLRSTTVCSVIAAKSSKKRIEKFFDWTSCGATLTSARKSLLFKILIFLICWIIWIQIKKISWFNILSILSILFHRNLR